MANPLFSEIISLSLVDLRRLRLTANLSFEESFYASVVIAHLSGDTFQLEELIGEYEFMVRPVLLDLARARLAIRQIREESAAIDRLLSARTEDPLEAGEIQFVIALYNHVLERFEQAKLHYLNAYKFLRESCEKKAVKALYNHYVSQSHIQPQKRFLSDLQFIRQEAERIGDSITLGLAYSSIGHEYHRLGAYQNALIFHEKALACLETDTSTYHYENTLANQCQTLLSLDRKAEAKLVLERIEHSHFREIQGAVAVLKSFLGQRNSLKGRSPDAVWDKKKKYHVTQRKKKHLAVLAELEEKLFHFIYERPRSKIEIIEHLYGLELPLESTENRFYNLLNRFQKKCPDLIVCEKGVYRIPEKMFLAPVVREILDRKTS